MRWFDFAFAAAFLFQPAVAMANGSVHIYVSGGPFAQTDYVVDFTGDNSGAFTIPGDDLSGTYAYHPGDSAATLVLNYTSAGTEGDQDLMNLVFTSADTGTFTGLQRVSGLLHLDFSGTFDGFQSSGFTNCCGGGAGGGPRPDLRPYAVQFGDAQRKPAGVQLLYRLATQVFISLDSEPDRSAVLANLTGLGKPLAGFTLEFDSGMNFILVAPASLTAGLVACPGSGQTLIESARQVPGVKIANPVFFSLDSNLRFVPQDDYILHLKTDVDVKVVVPTGRLIQPLGPLSNEFVVQAPGITWEDLIREVNVLTLDPRVDWAEPNYELDATGANQSPAAQFSFNPVAFSNTQACFPEQVRLSAAVSEGAQTITLTVSAVHNRIITIQKAASSGWIEVTNSVGGETATFILPFEKNSAATLFRALAY